MTQPGHKLWHFHGGMHLEGHKTESTLAPVQSLPLPKSLVLPLQQHIGEPAEPLVQVGDRVLTGQTIARASGYVSVPVHASTSGTVVEISLKPVPHPSGLHAPCIVIDTDGKDDWVERRRVDYRNLDPSALRNVIREAGLVGLGGAGFPSFIKMNPGPRREIETLILNGAECEPYITCDDMLMRQRADEVIAGGRIMRHALRARRCVIGVEDNKPEAVRALQQSLGRTDEVEIAVIPTIYPTGGEKQIIKVLTGKEVPSNGLPIDIGVVCHNVGTAAAVFRAVEYGEPLISRYVTVTGSGVTKPRNLEVRIGTPITTLLEHCHADLSGIAQLVLGGPMMGFALHTADVPITKTSNCILAIGQGSWIAPPAALPCIRCAECARVCPASLLPQQLYWYAHARDFDKVQDYNLFDCIECGCCAYVCPSHIPLVQYYRFAKTSIWAQEREKQKSDVARKRHEFRIERLERDKREREQRHREKLEALARKKGEAAPSPDTKKAAIEAALARVREKQKAEPNQPKNIDNLTPQQQELIKTADERRARLRAKQSQNKVNDDEEKHADNP